MLGTSPAPGSAAAGADSYPSVAEARAEFGEVCRRMKEGDAPFFGDAVLRRLEADLAAGVAEPSREVALRERLAFELLRVGRNEEAVQTLERLLAPQPVQRAPLPPDIRRRLRFSLAVAHLRLSELQNCAAMPGAGRCILPFTREAVHAMPVHGRAAGDILQDLLAEDPSDVQARWLLNLARMATGDYPEGVPAGQRLPEAVFAPATAAPFPHWHEIAFELGVASADLAGGAVMDDFDGDGLLDIVTSTMDPCGPLKAFRNDGHGGFEDVAEAWGLAGQLGGLNLLQADFDNDGMLDLLVLRGGWMGSRGAARKSLLRNDLRRPAHRFVDVTAAAGLAYPVYPTQAATWSDLDGDGDLDLYVGNEGEIGAGGVPGQPQAAWGAGSVFLSQLFRNNGDGTFTDVARAAGVAAPGFAKGLAAGDYDGDGRQDLYVSVIGPNRMYRNMGNNKGDVTFTDQALRLGVTEPSGPSFATWFFDFDDDGDLDLFVADYSARAVRVSASYMSAADADPSGHPVLYRNDLATLGRFTDVSAEAGLTRPLLPMGANHGDLDNDGFPDLYLGTGVPDFAALMPNVMLHSVPAPAGTAGRRFEDVSFAGGFAHLQKGHGVAFGDLDNDGDQDLFEQMGGAYPSDGFADALYENPGPSNAWVTLRLHGVRANRFGVGARIEVQVRERGGLRRAVHTLAGSGGSFGGSSLQAEIGLGAAEALESITVRWPGSGAVQVFRDVAPNRFYEVIEGEPRLRPLDLPRLRLGLRAAARER